MWFACKSTCDSTGGRAHNPPSLSVSTILVLERSPYSYLVMMKMKHTHTYHSQARVRANGDKRATWMEIHFGLQCSRLKVATATKCFSAQTLNFLHFRWNGFFTRRAGPPTTAWPQRHDEEEDFLALVRHNESTRQELIEWLGAWVRKQGFLHWVLLWDCASVHRKASLLEWIRTAHPECHVLFILGGYTAEAAASRHRDPAASEAQ